MKKPKPVKKVIGAVGSTAKGAERVLFAGLGALSRAEEEGRSLLDSDKSELVDDLVSEGRKLAGRAAVNSSSKFNKVQGAVRDSFSKAREQASEQYDRVLDQAEGAAQSSGIDHLIEEQVATALTALGYPDKKQFDALSRKVRTLQKKIDALEAAAAGEEPG